MKKGDRHGLELNKIYTNSHETLKKEETWMLIKQKIDGRVTLAYDLKSKGLTGTFGSQWRK